MTTSETPRASGLLDVGDGQSIHWEEWGDPGGVPALFVHGGPGGGLGQSSFRHRFDLTRTRVIGFEQRGCGRSRPHASDPTTPLSTTADLVADMERLRVARGVGAWLVNGVSWGSTLALAYAQTHPRRVLGLILYAVTTTSRAEVDWITEGVGAVFPEAWDRFAGHAEAGQVGYRRGEGRLVQAYARLMDSPDPAVRDAASHEWALWEDSHVSIGAGGFARDPRWEDDRFRHAFVRLTTHCWSHDGFCDPPILDRMERLHDIPGTLIHGRRDISSPAITPWRLHRAWPGSQLLIDEGDAHGGVSMGERWRAANEDMVSALRR